MRIMTKWIQDHFTPEDRASPGREAKRAELPAGLASHQQRTAMLAPTHAQLVAGLDKITANNQRFAAWLDAIEAEPAIEPVLEDAELAARRLGLKSTKALYSRVARGQIPESAIYRTGSRIQFIVEELKKLKSKRGSR